MTFPAGVPYDAFKETWRAALEAPLPVGDPDARRAHFFRKYNLERSTRVEEAYEPSEALRQQMAQIDAPQTWRVLTEAWCVDSAFSLPVIARVAALNDAVTLVVLPRDAHLDVMDRYLTGGSRSIPKLVAFDADGNELFMWGPRPAAGAAFRQSLLEQGMDKPLISARMVDWYEAGGWQKVEGELAACLEHTREGQAAG